MPCFKPCGMIDAAAGNAKGFADGRGHRLCDRFRTIDRKRFCTIALAVSPAAFCLPSPPGYTSLARWPCWLGDAEDSPT